MLSCEAKATNNAQRHKKGVACVSNSVIKARNLTKVYDGNHVVDALNMNVSKGDIYGFIGRNGAGKSTTMKMICGLIESSEGSLELFGRQDGEAEVPGRIGSLIESPGLFNNFSAYNNLMVRALGLGVENAKEKCQELLEFVGLANTGSRKAKDFSLGMRQRLGIAIALVGEPELLLLDEPFNGLDPEATHTMRVALQKLNAEKGITIVVSSHVLDQLNRFATCFGVIDEGRMVAEFNAEEMHSLNQSAILVHTADMLTTRALIERAFPQAVITGQLGEVAGAKGEGEGTGEGAGAKSAGAGESAGARAGVEVKGATKNEGAGAKGKNSLLISNAGSLEEISALLYKENQQVIELTTIEHDVEEFFLSLMRSNRTEGGN